MQDVISDCDSYYVGEASVPINFAGFFQQSWTPTSYTAGGTNYDTLKSGRVYTVASYVGLGSGATFKTPVSFTVTIPMKMASMEQALASMDNTIDTVLDKPISEVNEELQDAMETQTGIIETKMEAQEKIISDATQNMEDMIDDAMTSFETSVAESVTLLKSSATTAGEAAGLLETTALKYSWKATVSPDPALLGDKVSIIVQGQPSLSPMLDVYSWDNKVILNDIQLEDPEAKGIYKYEFDADDRFPGGKAYTFVIVEKTTDGFIAGSGMVEAMSLTTIAGLAAAAPEAERVAKKALDAIKAVEAVVVSGDNINIALTLKNLKESVDALPETIAKESPSPKILQTVNEISDKLSTLAGDEGYDLSTLLESAINESPTVKDIRGRTDAINSVVDILQQIFEQKFGGVDTPFISTSLQAGSVKFRIVAVNPSKFKAQSIEVRYDLPEEVKPKDVMDTAGLDLEYNPDKSIYYVHKSGLELAPAEVRAFEVEVEDVWIMPENNLGEVKTRVDSILGKLENTQYYTKAKEIADTIYPRLDEIVTTQSDESISRERHIGVYRGNLLTLAQVKEDIGRMEKILVTAGGPPAPEMLAKTRIKADEPSKTMTWILIFVIIIFTGLLTAVLFFTWLRQARITKESLLESKKAAFPEAKEEEKQSERGK
jgi:hypothetical protein